MIEQNYESEIREDEAKLGKDLVAMIKDRISKITTKVEKVSGDTKENIVGAAKTVKKEVGHGLDVYNAKAQEYAGKVPGDLNGKVSKYPWVAITVGLGIGLLVGGLLKPSHRS